ncbi:MAG: T9SS type A sorting domain-containing protein, partial [Candidatus Edwardsbacteria bacterium]
NDEWRIANSERQTASGEFLIDTSVVYVPAAGYQRSPSVAFDGTNYLVVWQDYRSGFSSDIYGARVNQSGTVLDTSGIAISTAASSQYYPSVAFDGTNYLVVWQDYRGSSWDIYGARVNQSGTVLDSSGIAISLAASSQSYPSVAFDGTNYLVVWGDYRGSSWDIYGARVNQSGTVLDTSGIAISLAASSQSYPSVAFDSTNYLVVWQDSRSGFSSDIYGARVNQSGTVLDTSGIAISTAADDQYFPSVAFDGINYLVVWDDYRSGSSSDIYGARVSQSVTVLDTSGIAISLAADDQYSPSVAFDGINYLVVWDDYRSGFSYDIYGARVNQSGTVLDSSGIAISLAADWQYFPSVAFDGTNYLVVWQDYRGTSSDIYGARVNQSGTVLDTSGIAISTAADYQRFPSVAFDGTNYLVVWGDYRGSSYDIYGARVNQSGTVLDPSGIAISLAASDQWSPSVAFDGTNYLVVWGDYRSGTSYDIYGARVNQSGTVLDTSGIAISLAADEQYYPSVAFDGTNYLVVWQDSRSGTSSDIYGARVNQSGTVLDTSGIAISTAADWQYFPSVAFDGTNYLVVWQDYRSGTSSDIYGARVNQSGTVLDTSGIAIFLAADDQYSPSVAFDGTNYLVVWYDYRSGSSWDIYGARVNQSGTVLDTSGIAISTAAHSQYSPSVAFDGTNYLVVWQDYRSYYSSDIYGARVNQSGAVIDSFAVSLQSGNQISPALAPGLAGQMLITYSGWTDSINGKPANTMRIWGKLYPFTGVEETSVHSSKFVVHSKLYQNAPNPFSKATEIRYQIPDCGRLHTPCPLSRGIMRNADSGKRSAVSLKIYNIAGQLVKTLVNELTSPSVPLPVGEGRVRSVVWDGRDESGKCVASGVYFYRLQSGDFTDTKKMILVR